MPIDHPLPPCAPKKVKSLTNSQRERQDPYYWMNERDNPDLFAYLEAENQYAEACLKPIEPLIETLYEEIKGRIEQTDQSVPHRVNQDYHYVRYEEEKAYPIYCRRPGSLTAPEEILLDLNELSKDEDYCDLGDYQISADGRYLAYTLDTEGRRLYTLHLRDLKTNALLSDQISGIKSQIEWSENPKTFETAGISKDSKNLKRSETSQNQTWLLYLRPDPETLRPFQVYQHPIGVDPKQDRLLYEENDDTFSLSLSKSKSKDYIFIVSHQTTHTEYHLLNSRQSRPTPEPFCIRQKDLEYDVDHLNNRFFILTNHQAKNFRLMAAELGVTDLSHWKELIPHNEQVLLEDFELFNQHLVLVQRKQGLTQIQLYEWNNLKTPHTIAFDDPCYTADLQNNDEPDEPFLRIAYSSMSTPRSVYDWDLSDHTRTLQKQQKVLGPFNQADYQTERTWATAPDGTQIPISLVYHKNQKKKSGNPLLLYGYGAYGHSLDASFSSARLSLLDRGFVFAIAHVRGGEELGRPWYEQGRQLQKKNTFTDFIACTEHLIQIGIAHPKQCFAMGGSAGGLLMGAIANLRPDLYLGIVAQVPFVDVVTTMLDPNIPLTTGEYDEWGNPHELEFYDYILSYSPYDNVQAQAYPHLLVVSSFQDSQVQYWEPTKWVAKLRSLKTNDNVLLLKTEMAASHSGPSSRFDQYREIALDYGFILHCIETVSKF